MNEEIKKLKEKVPESGTKEMDKTIFRIYHVFDDSDIEYGTLINYIYDINKYEATPINSQPKNNIKKLSPVTNTIIPNVKNDK